MAIVNLVPPVCVYYQLELESMLDARAPSKKFASVNFQRGDSPLSCLCFRLSWQTGENKAILSDFGRLERGEGELQKRLKRGSKEVQKRQPERCRGSREATREVTREGRESFSHARRGSGEVLVMQVLAQKQLNLTNSTTTEERPDPLESTTGNTHPTTTTRWPARPSRCIQCSAGSAARVAAETQE